MKSGDRITFTLLPNGTVLMRAKTRPVKTLGGILYKKGRKPVRVDDLSF
jgi:hypothetical protein